MTFYPVSNNGFRAGDEVVIAPNAYVSNSTHILAKAEGLHGVITGVPASYLVRIEWENGRYSSIADDLLAKAPLKKEVIEMAAQPATARVNIKLQFDHASLAEEIIAFRDRLHQAGFTNKQATRIAKRLGFAATITPEEV